MFTENQVRQFYVATSTAADIIAPVQVSSSTSATDLTAKSAGAAQFITNPTGDEMYLMYKGPSSDGLQRSDLIKRCNVMDVRLTDAADMKHTMKKVEITLSSSVNSGAPIVGEDYVLNVDIVNYIANGYDSTLNKFAAAKAYTSTASDLYKALAVNLAKNFSREPVKLISVSLKGISGEVTGKVAPANISGTATGIVIEEVEQPWRRGAAPQEFVNFTVSPTTVYVSSVDADLIWGTVTDVTASNTNKLPNSKKVADMEWFFHKERGDVYGELGYPYNIDTVYQVNPEDTTGYSFVDIHYYFEGNSHNVGHSEKTLTIVGTKANLKKLIGNAATTGTGATAATGLYAFLEGTGITPKTSASW